MSEKLKNEIEKILRKVKLLSFNRLKAYSESKIYTYLDIKNKKINKKKKEELLKNFFEEKSEFSYNININEISESTSEVSKKKNNFLDKKK